MANYDLTALDDKAFEALCCQLLTNVLGVRFEHFKKGKDGGVDGRFFTEDKNEVVLQCKHWARSPVNALLRALKDTELAKVTKLQPARYLLATSMELGRSDKQKIKAIFSDFIWSESDVFGYEDINDLLAIYPDIYKQYPQLWLSSAEVIGLIENAAILGRSEYSLNEIRQKAIRYVETANHRAAKDKLEKLGTVLITGLPGIGKTTLAEQLCLEYVLANYELCVLGQSIEEAESIFKKDTQQIFYFDDFLGRNYLEALNRHEDSRIVGFIKRISKDPQKRFVLTSRTTVLNQAKILSDQFSIAKVNRNEFEIQVASLEPIDKARILHKHIWFSDLAPEFIDQILFMRRYREIIDHQNFSPRLIQFITDAQRFDEAGPQQYWDYVLRTLSNPAAVWEHVFDSQLDDFSRAALLLTVFNGGLIREDDLRNAFERFRHEHIASGYQGSADFNRNSRLVTGSVLNRSIGYRGVTSYSLFNPSIADYVLTRVPYDQAMLASLYFCLNTLSSLKNLDDLIDNKIIASNIAMGLIETLIARKLSNSTLEITYRLELADIGMAFLDASKSIRLEIFNFLSSMPTVDETFDRWDLLGGLLAKGIRAGLFTSKNTPRHFSVLNNLTIDYSDIDGMVELYEVLDEPEQVRLGPILKNKIIEYWEDAISETVSESSTMADYYSDDDGHEVRQAVRSLVEERLDVYPFRFTTNDIEKIAECIDPYDVIYQNQKSFERDKYEERTPVVRDGGADAIDDLFNVDFPRS